MLNEKIDSHAELIRWVDKKIGEPGVPNTPRALQSCACLQLTMEHQKAIVLMVSNELYGPASALMRPCTEAFVRGIWLLDCAADIQVEKFSKGQDPPKFGALISDLEKTVIFSAGVLSRAKKQNWKILNGLTHGGAEQTSRRLSGTSIGPNFLDDELCEILDYSMSIGVNAAINICRLTGADEIAEEILDKVRKM